MTILRNPPKDYIAPNGLLPSGSSSTECPRGKAVDTEHVVLKFSGGPSNPLLPCCGGTEHEQLCGSSDGRTSAYWVFSFLSYYFHCCDFVSRFVNFSLTWIQLTKFNRNIYCGKVNMKMRFLSDVTHLV
jgi:hypothetical protein